MDTLHIYTVGGDTVILAGGVSLDEIENSGEEILKNAPMHVQAGFIASTEIKIPRMVCAANVLSADCALCFGAYLSEISEKKSQFTISSTGVDTPFCVSVDTMAQNGTLLLAAKAKTVLTAAVPSVLFGGCEYFIAEGEMPENAEDFLAELSENSTAEATALLCKQEQNITAFFRQKERCVCGFSAGSAAIALAFYESDSSRDYFKAVYRFEKGEREVEIKRFLSEAFDAKLSAKIEKRG